MIYRFDYCGYYNLIDWTGQGGWALFKKVSMKTCELFREILCLSVAVSLALLVALVSVPAGYLHKAMLCKGDKVQGGKVQRIKRNQRIERSVI